MPANFTVNQPVTSIWLDTSSKTMEAGEIITLTATVYPDNASNKRYTFSSSDPTIASVNEKGVILALKKGTATITVKAVDEIKNSSGSSTDPSQGTSELEPNQEGDKSSTTKIDKIEITGISKKIAARKKI